jgi:UDP-N-acetylmuramate dehydrogenase
VNLVEVADALDARLPGSVTRNAAIADFTTYRVGGPAAVLVRVASEDALRTVSSVLGCRQPPLLVVGRGSNLLVADAGFPGVALVLGGAFETLTVDADSARVRAGGAVALPVLARRAAAAGVSGLEFFVGIPGSLGGAVKMNAGGHGRETSDVLERAWLFDVFGGTDAKIEERAAGDLALAYRHSSIAPSQVVVSAQVLGEPDDATRCEARIAEIVHWRREHQPGGSNAGSVFQNPPNDSAGRLIDAAGLKGLRVGGAVVSSKHANFFQAEPGATADDVARLVETVRARVAAATGVALVPELRMIGFADRDQEDDA